jgi:eukaryotic-like serine/threonine-protein kinase
MGRGHDMLGSPTTEIGHYQLRRLLGRGGMGEVYLAHDTALDREVAIKFVAPDRAADPEARRRLLREAHAAASLDHPYICTVHETGETPDGRAYIVMQYVEGESVADRLRRGPLPPREALSLAAHVAEALAIAHARKIVHRDLKPSNVLLGASGRPRLVDFGIAKAFAVPAEMANAPTMSGATAEGFVFGTAAYMSPEQVQQRPLDGRSDLFSLGVLLYECLTGRRPFERATSLETLANILHVNPPAPSTIAPGLTEQHDELCRRLLAKEPDDRFQSADEVVGAIRMLAPTHTEPLPVRVPGWGARLRAWVRRRPSALAAPVVGLGIALYAFWPPPAQPAPPPEAEYWYDRGTDAVRRGSPVTAQRALERAVRVFPGYAVAHARLAEAHAELDDFTGAHERLLRVSSLVPNESRLPQLERLRLQALRSFVLRDIDGALTYYRLLSERQPDDARAWLDLGRALEAAGRQGDARASYQRAIEGDREYAAAHLRLASLESQQLRRDEALTAFAEAERLYRAVMDVEGEAEVFLRRGAMHEASVHLKEARADLERALLLSRAAGTDHQQVRAQLTLSGVTASEGRLAEAEQIAEAAIRAALAANLDTIAADGLVELAATLTDANRTADAEQRLLRAVQMAERREAGRTAARARIQLASLYQATGRSDEALTLVDGVLPFVREQRYRRFEFSALLIAARLHQQADRLDRARETSAQLLAAAEALHDDAEVARMASNLASVTAALGDYPAALGLRERAEAIVRTLGDEGALPFHLANRADLLINLGRAGEAETVLAELEAGIREKRDAYVGRAYRVQYLRMLAAAVELRCDQALRNLPPPLEAPNDSAAVLAPAVARFCEAQSGRRSPASPRANQGVTGALHRERQYWHAAAALARNDYTTALAEVRQGFDLLDTRPNDQLRWRLSLVGVIAARRGDVTTEPEMAGVAAEAESRLREAWGEHFAAFAQRPDILHLATRAGRR